MIKVSHLNKIFISKEQRKGFGSLFKPRILKEFVAVKDLDLEIREGEFVAFLGPNGAGKTTTLKMLSGILYPTSGEVDVFGFKPFEKKTEFKKFVSFVMAQKTQLFLELPVQDTFDFIAEIYEVDKDKYKTKLNALVKRFDLEDKLQTTGRRLSLGQRMKCELICSLIYEPKVIFLDEPTIGLDVNSSKEVRKFLKEVNKEYKTTIILTTHNMDDVEELCDRTIVINKGEKVFDGKTKELKQIFGDAREIEFVISGDNNHEDLVKSLGQNVKILENTPSIIRVECEKKQSSVVIQKVMSICTVEEVNFKESDLSDVIGKVYKQ